MVVLDRVVISEAATIRQKTGQLDRSAKKHDAEQHRHIDSLADKIADVQPEHIVTGRGDAAGRNPQSAFRPGGGAGNRRGVWNLYGDASQFFNQ